MKKSKMVWVRDPIKDVLQPEQRICVKKICDGVCIVDKECTCHHTTFKV